MGWGYVYLNVGGHGGQKRAPGPLDLELQVVVSFLVHGPHNLSHVLCESCVHSQNLLSTPPKLCFGKKIMFGTRLKELCFLP